MNLKKISQLNVDTWQSSSDSLIKTYRDYAENGKIGARKTLLLAATIHAVKTVGFSALSAFGLLIYCASLGKVQNRYWNYALLHSEMAKVAFLALFFFKPMMEELRLAEAKAFCQSALTPNVAALYLEKPKNPIPAFNPLEKLKRLSADQLKQVIATEIPPDAAKGLKFVTMLQHLKHTGDEAVRNTIAAQMVAIQKDFYNKYKTLIGIYQESAQEPARIAFLPTSMQDGILLPFPDLTKKIADLRISGGSDALPLTRDQYAFCYLVNPSSYKSIATPIFPSPASLEVIAKIGCAKAKKTYEELLKPSCKNYVDILKKQPDALSKDEVASLKITATMLENKNLLLACFRAQNDFLSKNGRLSSAQLQKQAQDSFELIEKVGYQNITSHLFRICIRNLCSDLSESWITGRDEKSLSSLIQAIHEVGSRKKAAGSNATFPTAGEYGAQLLEWSLATGCLTLLHLPKKIPLASSWDSHLLRLWNSISSDDFLRTVMTPICAINQHYKPEEELLAIYYPCPKLAKSLFDFAKQSNTLRASPHECEKILISELQNRNYLQNLKTGLDDRELWDLIADSLVITYDHKLQGLAEVSIDILLSHFEKFKNRLEEFPDEIAQALDNSKREVSFTTDEQKLFYAKEGLALVQYAADHANSIIAKALLHYVHRTPAYRQAITILTPKEQETFSHLSQSHTLAYQLIYGHT